MFNRCLALVEASVGYVVIFSCLSVVCAIHFYRRHRVIQVPEGAAAGELPAGVLEPRRHLYGQAFVEGFNKWSKVAIILLVEGAVLPQIMGWMIGTSFFTSNMTLFILPLCPSCNHLKIYFQILRHSQYLI